MEGNGYIKSFTEINQEEGKGGKLAPVCNGEEIERKIAALYL